MSAAPESRPPGAAPAAAGDALDLRREALAARSRQRWRWGSAVAALGLLSWLSAGGFFLYAALVVAVLLGLATVLTRLSLLGLRIERSLSATEIPLGATVDARLALRNAKAWPALWLFWRDQISDGLDLEGISCAAASLAGGAGVTLGYRLHSLRRGLFRIGPAVVEASGPFGLVRRYLIDREPLFLTVLPRTVAIGRSWPLGHRPIHEVPRRRSLFEDPSRFLGVREYRPGDPLRRIHWRATARSGSLQVKLFEPAVLEGILLAIEMGDTAFGLDQDRPGRDRQAAADHAAGDEAVELAVTTAASLAEFVLRGGQKVGLLSNGSDAAEAYAGDWTGGTFRRLGDALAASEGGGISGRKLAAWRPLEVAPGKGGWQGERLRTALARLTLARGPSLPELLHAELPSLPRSLVLTLVTPRFDAAAATVVGELRRSGLEVAVVRVDRSPAGGRRSPTAARGLPLLPGGVPAYSVAGEKDLLALGGQRL